VLTFDDFDSPSSSAVYAGYSPAFIMFMAIGLCLVDLSLANEVVNLRDRFLFKCLGKNRLVSHSADGQDIGYTCALCPFLPADQNLGSLAVEHWHPNQDSLPSLRRLLIEDFGASALLVVSHVDSGTLLASKRREWDRKAARSFQGYF